MWARGSAYPHRHARLEFPLEDLFRCQLLALRSALRSVEWAALAGRYNASFSVIECVCSDEAIHRERVQGRVRAIPGWYELEWGNVEASRQHYVPLPEPKLVLDAVESLDVNLERAMRFLGTVC